MSYLKENINKSEFIKKKFCFLRDMARKIKRQPIEYTKCLQSIYSTKVLDPEYVKTLITQR